MHSNLFVTVLIVNMNQFVDTDCFFKSPVIPKIKVFVIRKNVLANNFSASSYKMLFCHFFLSNTLNETNIWHHVSNIEWSFSGQYFANETFWLTWKYTISIHLGMKFYLLPIGFALIFRPFLWDFLLLFSILWYHLQWK